MSIDFLVLGGGIAGASAGYFLADHGRVTLIEKEDALGYHATGRSAALYTETYGNAVIRALTVASGPFFRAPPAGFADRPLLRPRGELLVAAPEDERMFAAALAEGRRFVPTLRAIGADEALHLCPVLRRDSLGHALYNPDAADMDTHAIHHGFLRGLRAQGGTVVTGAAPQSIARRGGLWRVATGSGTFAAPVVVNASGAWADEVARLAGVQPVGLTAKRRTAFTIEAPPDATVAGWPMVVDVGERFYFKPESGLILISPADETPMPPCDVRPDEIDIAIGAARIEAATRLEIRRIVHKWAGLRTFAPDRTPVVGPAPDAPGFVWLAGQGGYGIMTSPAMGRAAAALAIGASWPEDLAALGLAAEQVLPDRLVKKT